MYSGPKGNFPVHQTLLPRIDQTSPANRPPLVQRFVDTGDVNRFRLVRNQWLEEEKNNTLMQNTNGNFFCANDELNLTANANWIRMGRHLCHDFAIEVVEETGIDLFRLQSGLTKKYIKISNRGEFDSHVPANDASTFFLVDEPENQFFVVQLYKDPFYSINEKGTAEPYYRVSDTFGLANPPTLMGIPLIHNNLMLDYMNFANYSQASAAKQSSRRVEAALFNLVYNPRNETVSLRFINYDLKILWLCFKPINEWAKRSERFPFVHITFFKANMFIAFGAIVIFN